MSGRKTVVRRLTWAILALSAVGLLASSVYRASTFPFVHDESLSFAIFNGEPGWGATANNHQLNTFLMQLSSTLFGNSELSLRTPNVLAHLIYLVFSILLLTRLKNLFLQVVGFIFLNLNPFLLDFFFLARGYGLALGFLMLSLYLLSRAYEEKTHRGFEVKCFGCGLAGSLAVAANLSFLTYYVPLLLTTAWVLSSDSSSRRIDRRRIHTTAALLGAGGLVTVLSLYHLEKLQRAGELYFGGDRGFVTDTIHSLVRASVYSSSYPRTTTAIVSFVLVALLVAVLVFGAWRFLCGNDATVYVFIMVLVGTTGTVFAAHYVGHTLWSIERAAIYFIPLYAVTLLFAFDLLTRLADPGWKLAATLILPVAAGVLLSWQFVWNWDLHSSYVWGYDRHNKDALAIVKRDRNKSGARGTVRLGVSWVMEPSLNFYRVSRKYTWLAPVTRNDVTDGRYDYVYGFESDVEKVRDRSVRLASFDDTKTVLVRLLR